MVRAFGMNPKVGGSSPSQVETFSVSKTLTLSQEHVILSCHTFCRKIAGIFLNRKTCFQYYYQEILIPGQTPSPLQWRHNGRDGVSNHQPHHCLLNRLFMRKWKKTSRLRVTGLRMGNSPVTGEFPAQMASNAENFSIWWRHHVETGPGFEDGFGTNRGSWTLSRRILIAWYSVLTGKTHRNRK